MSVKWIIKQRKRTVSSVLITILGIVATFAFPVIYLDTPQFVRANVDPVPDQNLRTIPNTSNGYSVDNSSRQNTFVDAEHSGPPGLLSTVPFYPTNPFHDGEHRPSLPARFDDVPSLDAFRRSVTNGNGAQLTGIWVDGILAYKVLPGSKNKASSRQNTAVIYQWAEGHGVTALLVHNYLGGTRLYNLDPGVRIAAIYGNGAVDWYLSRGGTWYESRDYSDGGFKGPFRLWSCSGCKFDISVDDIRWRHYSGAHHLAFQTCAYSEGRTGIIIVEAYFLEGDSPPYDEGKITSWFENKLALIEKTW